MMMTDPITIGVLATTALSMAAEAALKGSIGEAAKDAYNKLKAKVSEWAGNDVEALEKSPTSNARKTVIAEELDRLTSEQLADIGKLAQALKEVLEKRSSDGDAVGVLLRNRLKAENVRLRDIDVVGPNAKGVVFEDEVEVAKDVTIEKVKVRDASGKAIR
jgi:uncharacterized protein YicC (UPF0701 family)